MHFDALCIIMQKLAAVTVRLSPSLKRRLQDRARREHRSLSAQVEYELARSLDAETVTSAPRKGRFLGRYAGGRVPREEDFVEVRAALWGKLGRRDARRG